VDLVITPTTPTLSDSTHYAVLIDTNAIKDYSGEFFAGFTNTVDWDWDFATTTVDNDPPTLQTKSPADDATDVALETDLVATFNENIAAGSGNIVITNLTDGTATTIAVTDWTQVTIVGSNLTVNPTANLLAVKQYAILIDYGAIQDDPAGNPFAGISSTNEWNFATIVPTTYTWTNTAAGSSGYWTNASFWNPPSAYPDNGDTANLNGAISSGAYTNILDYTIPGTLAALTLNSGGGAGQAWLVVTNAALSANTLNLGNVGVLRIDAGGAVTNSAALTADWWTGTSGTIYPNSGGTFVTPLGATIGYNLSGRKATVSSTDSLGGIWNFVGGLRVGYCTGNSSAS